ncbi:DUF4331 family protein [Mariniblastus fucicola]|uniref:PEP-CTERM protein-sorting domain-containing protein n=1 Tax=Mariniblastus fucicola TaxID=980251 RepID=A0A5B9PD86_9BACT|nr:DUF4331 family protein [Mariniblastus fucicola]QEG23419.1 hypothetical protein MFFC18_33180 [Mariniblastus fucicola]
MKSISLLAAISMLMTAASFVTASDHLDAPNLSGDGQADVNDLYAFQAPENSGNSVFIMTVNPFAGSMSPTDFGTDVSYQFQIDNTGDAIADLTYEATFSGSGNQGFTFREVGGSTLATGNTGANLSTSNGGTVHAGVFDDPFFFDLVGFQNGFNFTGEDTFAGAEVSAIIFELPSLELGGPNIGVWARTLRDGVQIDRAGRPAINTALIADDRKQDFNEGSPNTDFDTFGAEVNAAIAGLSNQENADALTPILLPDVLTFDTSSSAGFLNGRGLADDVMDAELNLLSAGAVTGDGVDGNDVPFSSVFPYLGVAAVPEPTGLVPVCLLAFGVITRRRRDAKAC